MRTIRILAAIVLALTISTTWSMLAKVRELPQFYTPLALQCFLGAGVLATLLLAFERRLPMLSLRSAHAAVTEGTLIYFLSSAMFFWSLKWLPSGIVGVISVLTPLWLFAFGMGSSYGKLKYLAGGLVGTALMVWATGWTAHPWSVFGIAVLASALYATGIAMAKRVFWIHSATELNFWSLIFGGTFCAILGFINLEWGKAAEPIRWSSSNLMYLAYGGMVICGVASYSYRYIGFQPDKLSTFLMTLIVPAGALGISIYSPGSSVMKLSMGPLGICGAVIAIGSLLLAGRGENSSFWMGHYLNNSRRQGDRVMCALSGFVKGTKGGIHKIEVTDLSIGGLGFRCDSYYEIGDEVVVTLPMGLAWTQVGLDCRVIHIQKNENNTQFPWTGGLIFKNVTVDNLQYLVEFLAKIGAPHADRESHGKAA